MAFTKIVIVLVVSTVFISLVSSQNCTNNEFIVGGVCKTCGDNSNSNIDRTECPCISKNPPYKRLPDVKDYTKPCYRSPSEPRNVTVFKINSTEIIYRWQEPETNDKHLPTKFLLHSGKCIENKCKMETVTGNRGQDTEYVKSGLIPRTTYHFIVCAFNDVSESKPACVDPNHMPAVRTLDGKPGKFANFQLQFTKGSEYYYFFFPPPNHWGEKQITVKISCEDEAKTTKSKNFTETNLKEKYDIQVPRICAKTVRCSIYAANTKGKGESLSKIFTINDDCKVINEGSSDTVAITVSIVVVIVVIVLIAFGYLRWWKSQQEKMERRWIDQLERANNLSNTMTQPFRPRNLYVDAMDVQQSIARAFEGGDMEEEAEYFQEDIFEFEFSRENLNFLHKLGEGNFAYVFKAIAMDIAGRHGDSQVAVKVLKDSADEKDQTDFMDELKLMKFIKPNKNVVRLLGCCTGKGQVAMIVEYLPAGDLLDYLRKSRQYADEKGVCSNLTEKDFLKFAHDIAAGMAHLANHNIVHRDLACRNVLVGANRICKIADLGLARQLGDNGVYLREKEAKLPIKWMAPESLFHGRSLVKSDVWAFGIVFWEIVTVGASPYPGYKSKDIALLLKNKYRMEKPEHCSEELYNIMKDCWHEEYDLRPTFDMLEELLRSLTETDENYMNFDTFQEDLYISFDDVDDDMNLDQINTNQQFDDRAFDDIGLEVDLRNSEGIKYNLAP